MTCPRLPTTLYHTHATGSITRLGPRKRTPKQRRLPTPPPSFFPMPTPPSPLLQPDATCPIKACTPDSTRHHTARYGHVSEKWTPIRRTPVTTTAPTFHKR